MSVSTLGYVVVESADLPKWRSFASEAIGLMEGAPGPDGSLRLRIDQRPFRIAVVPGSAERFLAVLGVRGRGGARGLPGQPAASRRAGGGGVGG